MNTNEIREKWVVKEKNRQAAVDLWDSMADQFSDNRLPHPERDPFLKLLDRLEVLDPSAHILDVGCGCGRYSLVLADRCKSVTGVDLSGNMLAHADKQRKQMRLTNVSFLRGDWHETDLEQCGMMRQYDLVFAHMTPAIQSADTFEKLIHASKNWCVMVKPTRRTDPISDAVKRLAGVPTSHGGGDESLIYAFAMLWEMGMRPYVEYRNEQWNMEKTIEEAYGLYINRVKSYQDITQEKEEELKVFIRSKATNGTVRELVDTTITTLYWQV